MRNLQDLARRAVRSVKRVIHPYLSTTAPVPGDPRVTPKLPVVELRSLEAFKEALESWPEVARPSPPDGAAQWSVPGLCGVSGKDTLFRMDDLYADRGADGDILYNWRERLVCECCGLNSRQRACIHLFEQAVPDAPTAKVWITEQVTTVYRVLKQRSPLLIGSEFLGVDWKSGSVSEAGVRHEDVTSCSFADQTLNAILSFDVFEHVPDPAKAFRECARVLAPGGTLLFTVPFLSLDEATRVRARIENGNLVHLMDPQYHGDPVQPEKGVLCFQEFGWDILGQLRDAGFMDASMLAYESAQFAYLGGPQFIIRAVKQP